MAGPWGAAWPGADLSFCVTAFPVQKAWEKWLAVGWTSAESWKDYSIIHGNGPNGPVLLCGSGAADLQDIFSLLSLGLSMVLAVLKTLLLTPAISVSASPFFTLLL